MVTVLLGLLLGVGWISVPFPEKIASNLDCSHTSSILIVLGDPWNLTLSDLHSFFSLRVDDGKPERGGIRHGNWAYRSNIFLTCILDFFSSALDGPAMGASDEVEEEAVGPRSSWHILQVAHQHIAVLRAEFDVNLSVPWMTMKIRHTYL